MMKFLYLLIVGYCLTGCCGSTSKQPDSKTIAMNDSTNHETNDTLNTQSFSCKLTTPELQKRKAEVIAVIKKQVKGKMELPNGYRYSFDGTDEILETVAAFIKSERTCCGFFNFTMAVTNDDKISLDITGAKGVKEFIKTELEM
ncbi:MAG: hypothetical protein GXC72_01345 [Chitinophagaceae bacterium]|nr:hypothetical protein [Chitinophagaceae bacterium]